MSSRVWLVKATQKKDYKEKFCWECFSFFKAKIINKKMSADQNIQQQESKQNHYMIENTEYITCNEKLSPFQNYTVRKSTDNKKK